MSAPRGLPGDALPWCWQEKAALRELTEAFGENDTAARARSVYVALTELASDAGASTFQASKALIGYRAGVSVKSVERTLKRLAVLEFIAISSNAGLKLANEYTLLSMRHDDASIRHSGEQLSEPDKVEKEKKKIEKTAAAPARQQKQKKRFIGSGSAYAAPQSKESIAIPEKWNF